MARWIGLVAVVAAAGLAGCASDWEKRYEQSQRENLDLVEQNEHLRADTAEAVARAEGLDAQLKGADRDAQRTKDELAEAIRRANEWKAESEKGAVAPTPAAGTDHAAANALADRYRAQGGYREVRVTSEGNVEITLASDVTFGAGKAAISTSGKQSLKGLGTELNSSKFAPCMVRIEGHTDAQPIKRSPFKDNRDLGAERANEVVRFMEKEMGIAPGRLMSATMGEHKPVADNKSEAGRQKNRRVEVIVVIPNSATAAQGE